MRSDTEKMSWKIVGDEDYATTLCLQRLDQSHHLALFRHAESCSRLVHDQDPGVPMDRAADCDRLTLAAGKVANRRIESFHMEVELRHRFAGRLCHRLPVEDRQKAEKLLHRFAAKEDIGADRQIVGERQILVDRLYSFSRASCGEEKVTGFPSIRFHRPLADRRRRSP